MSDQIDDGGPAFPVPPVGTGDPRDGMTTGHDGMTLRDWFAGQEKIDPDDVFDWPLLEALAGPRPEGNWQSNPLGWFEWSNRWQARVRYARADAMIAAQNHKEAKP